MSEPREPPPRYAPELALPPYGYVPGRQPHPVRDPRGHRHGRTDADFGPPPDPERWRECRIWLHVVDLFNHGYYWEAHEALEKWWRELAPADSRHAFFHGLLRLAAAGVKAREGRRPGVRGHARRAAELLGEVAGRLGSGAPRLLGLEPLGLAEAAGRLAAGAELESPDGQESGLGVQLRLA